MQQKLLPLLLALFYIPFCNANSLFDGFSAHYDVSRNGIPLGVNKRQLVREAEDILRYTATTEAEGVVALFVSDVITEQSIISYRKGRLQPLKYTYQQTGGKKKKHVEVSFDWQAHKFSHSALPGLTDLPDNSYDLLSFSLAISKGLLQHQKEFIFSVIDHKRIRSHSLITTGSETFQTSQGKLETVLLEQNNANRGYRFSFWCAPEFDYLPVIIRKTELDGDVITMQLRQFNGKAFRFNNNNNDGD